MIEQAKTSTSIRPLRESELEEADRIFRLAFCTFLGLPEPLMFMGDAGYVLTRWQADPASAFAAEVDGELVGSNFATNWGSVGFFGPVSVRPDLWDKGIGARLVEPAMERFAEWGIEHAVSSPGPTAPSTPISTRSSVSRRAFSPQSCPSRLWRGGRGR